MQYSRAGHRFDGYWTNGKTVSMPGRKGFLSAKSDYFKNYLGSLKTFTSYKIVERVKTQIRQFMRDQLDSVKIPFETGNLHDSMYVTLTHKVSGGHKAYRNEVFRPALFDAGKPQTWGLSLGPGRGVGVEINGHKYSGWGEKMSEGIEKDIETGELVLDQPGDVVLVVGFTMPYMQALDQTWFTDLVRVFTSRIELTVGKTIQDTDWGVFEKGFADTYEGTSAQIGFFRK